MKVAYLSIILVFLFGLSKAQNIERQSIRISNPTQNGVMRLLFSNFDSTRKMSTWTCRDTGLLGKFSIEKPTHFISKILYLDSVKIVGQSSQLYMIISSRPEDYKCHDCSPVEEVLVFDKREGFWRLSYRKIFSQMGNWGRPHRSKWQI
jgi:hypothetical protein